MSPEIVPGRSGVVRFARLAVAVVTDRVVLAPCFTLFDSLNRRADRQRGPASQSRPAQPLSGLTQNNGLRSEITESWWCLPMGTKRPGTAKLSPAPVSLNPIDIERAPLNNAQTSIQVEPTPEA